MLGQSYRSGAGWTTFQYAGMRNWRTPRSSSETVRSSRQFKPRLSAKIWLNVTPFLMSPGVLENAGPLSYDKPQSRADDREGHHFADHGRRSEVLAQKVRRSPVQREGDDHEERVLHGLERVHERGRTERRGVLDAHESERTQRLRHENENDGRVRADPTRTSSTE